MSTSLEVLFSPAEFLRLPERDLSQTVCVVFDVLRATSTMITALANGATRIIPVSEISEALAFRRVQPEVLLAGERDGVRILRHQTGGTDFDLGNSPREFTAATVNGKWIVITTTNGTRALRACASAKDILVGAFLGMRALVDWVNKTAPANLLLVCAGTFEQASYEDTLAAGALAAAVWPAYENGQIADSTAIAREIYQRAAGDLLGAMQSARNGRRLLANSELRGDVPFCLQRDIFDFVAQMTPEGAVERMG